MFRKKSTVVHTGVAIRFGSCYYGANDGGRCVHFIAPATNANWDVGSALLLLPPAGVAV